MNSMKKILAYGEILWDMLPDKTILGGAPFNFAYRICALGDNGLFASRIGRDELGSRALAQAQKLGVNTSLLQYDDRHPTGTVDVSFHGHQPDYVINPGTAYDYIEPTDALIAAAETADCLYYGTLVQRSPQSRNTLYQLLEASPQSVKFLDINLRKKCYTPETVRRSLHSANILKLNDDEVKLLSALMGVRHNRMVEFSEWVIDEFKLDVVLITLGEFGAYAAAAPGETVYVPGYQVDLADSLGSGDAFSAAFVHAFLQGHALLSACELGNALGALVAATHGATAELTTQQINDLMNGSCARRFYAEFSSCKKIEA